MLSIVGERPESGVRIDVTRPLSGGPPWRYEGEAVTPEARFRMLAVVEAAGTVSVELPASEPQPAPASERGELRDLREKVRLMLRAVWKHASEEPSGWVPPPRRIVRWRPEP